MSNYDLTFGPCSFRGVENRGDENVIKAFDAVRLAYIRCLGRDYDSGGMKGYFEQLLQGHRTGDQVCSDMSHSEEAKAKGIDPQ